MDVIKELGLTLHKGFLNSGGSRLMAGEFIDASDVRAAIEKLQVVYGLSDEDGMEFSSQISNGDTHKARLIGVEKLVKEPVRVEFNAQVLPGVNNLNACIKRSELIPLEGKFVKVTVEEVIE